MGSASQPRVGDAGERRGGAFYDEPRVFERYMRVRQWLRNPNVVMEEPALLEELGGLSGVRVLDLGCGDAAMGRVVLDAGAACYLGVDGSARMVEAATAALTDTAGEVERCDIEEFVAAPGSFDLVLSRMALHYVDDVGRVLGDCYRWLSPGGRVVFTVAHPVITSHDARASTKAPRHDWVVDEYFVGGPREQVWLGGKVRCYHRTVEEYVRCLHDAGFTLANLRECAPVRERCDDAAEFERLRHVPLVLLLAGTRARPPKISPS